MQIEFPYIPRYILVCLTALIILFIPFGFTSIFLILFTPLVSGIIIGYISRSIEETIRYAAILTVIYAGLSIVYIYFIPSIVSAVSTTLILQIVGVSFFTSSIIFGVLLSDNSS